MVVNGKSYLHPITAVFMRETVSGPVRLCVYVVLNSTLFRIW